MKKVYIDPTFKCHVSPIPDGIPVETDFFDGKCDTYIEGYRLIPEGQSWTREDGTVFTGTMIAPWRPIDLLDAVQAEYNTMAISYREGVNSV